MNGTNCGTVNTRTAGDRADLNSGDSLGVSKSTARPSANRAAAVSWMRRISRVSAYARVEATISTDGGMAPSQV